MKRFGTVKCTGPLVRTLVSSCIPQTYQELSYKEKIHVLAKKLLSNKSDIYSTTTTSLNHRVVHWIKGVECFIGYSSDTHQAWLSWPPRQYMRMRLPRTWWLMLRQKSNTKCQARVCTTEGEHDAFCGILINYWNHTNFAHECTCNTFLHMKQTWLQGVVVGSCSPCSHPHPLFLPYHLL